MEHISVVKLTTGCGKKNKGFHLMKQSDIRLLLTLLCVIAVAVGVVVVAAVAAAAGVVAVVLNNLNFSARSLSLFIASCMAYLD